MTRCPLCARVLSGSELTKGRCHHPTHCATRAKRRTNFDRYVDEQMGDPKFRAAYERERLALKGEP